MRTALGRARLTNGWGRSVPASPPGGPASASTGHAAGVAGASGARTVGAFGAALVAGSVVGGVLSVLAGTNTWADAWSSRATLAAPWPMLLVQAASAVAAIQARRRVARLGSGMLAVTAGVAGISGFFDGQLARPDLSGWYVGAQVVYVAVAWATVVAAGLACWHLRPAKGSRTT